MSVHDLFHWWNLIYLLPLFMSVVWILSTLFAGVHGGHDFGHHHDLGHITTDAGHAIHGLLNHGSGGHAGAGHDAGAGHADAGHAHASHDHGHDAHGDGQSQGDRFMNRAFWFLGINDVPVTLLIGVFSLCWGMFGLLANETLGSTLKYPALYIWPSIAIAFFGSFVVTRTMAAIVGKYAPSSETYAINRFELVGSAGRTVHTTDEKIGTVDIKDKYGSVHRVQAKTESGVGSLPPLTDVIIIDYDDSDKRFIVRIGIS